MPESLYRQKKPASRCVEDVLHDVLGEDAGKMALAFVDALRDAKIRLSWTLTNQWKAVYKGRNLCRITLSSGQSWAQYRRWVVTAYLERLADYEQDGLRGGAGGNTCGSMCSTASTSRPMPTRRLSCGSTLCFRPATRTAARRGKRSPSAEKR